MMDHWVTSAMAHARKDLPVLPAALQQPAGKQKPSLFFHKQPKKKGKSQISALVQQFLQSRFSAPSWVLQALPFFRKTGGCLPLGDFKPWKPPPCPSQHQQRDPCSSARNRAGVSGGRRAQHYKTSSLVIVLQPAGKARGGCGKMRTVGLSLGLALLSLLCTEAQDLGAAGLDKTKIAGKWNIIALASNSERFLQRKDESKMAMANIEVLGDGNLKVSFAIPTPTGCKKSKWIYRQTGKPGEYHCAERSNTTVQVLDTDGETYAVIFASKVKDGKTFHMLRLYSRTREVSPRITALFKKLAREKSYTDEMIKMLPSQEECSVDEA